MQSYFTQYWGHLSTFYPSITQIYYAPDGYTDGSLGLVYPNYSFLPKDRKTLKQTILGNSPTGKGYWKGNIYGLAIYQLSLTGEQVKQHFQDWINGKPPSLLKDDDQSPISYFPFIAIRINNAIIKAKKGGVRCAECMCAKEAERQPSGRFRLIILPSTQPEYPDGRWPRCA